MTDVIENATSIQSIKAAEILLKYCEPKRKWKPEIVVYWGSTGTGKTKKVFDEIGDERHWVSGENLRNWEGYDAHDIVVLDDFDIGQVEFRTLLRILDRYEFRVNCKYGSRQLLAKKIYITCERHPADWYGPGTATEQLLRRIDRIEELVKCTDVKCTDVEVGNNRLPQIETPKDF